MTHSFIRNSMCWLEHMALDEKTGGDPPGVKLRAAEGLEAVDYFMPGYHVWAKLIEALADVGYESNMLVSARVSLFPCRSSGRRCYGCNGCRQCHNVLSMEGVRA